MDTIKVVNRHGETEEIKNRIKKIINFNSDNIQPLSY
jgi:hypothetical protein